MEIPTWKNLRFGLEKTATRRQSHGTNGHFDEIIRNVFGSLESRTKVVPNNRWVKETSREVRGTKI